MFMQTYLRTDGVLAADGERDVSVFDGHDIFLGCLKVKKRLGAMKPLQVANKLWDDVSAAC